MTAAQVREVGVAADAFAEGPDDSPVFGNRYADLTTRQDIQLHWIRIADVPRIWQRFWEVGLTTVQACGDSARNVCSCPVSGIDAKRGGRRLPRRPGHLGLLHRQPGVRQPAPQVQDRRHRLHRGLRPGRDQRHRPVAGRARRRHRRLQRARSAAGSPTGSAWRRTSTSSSARTRRSSCAGAWPSSSASWATARTAAWPACATWPRSSAPRGSAAALDERTNFALEPAGRELTTALPGRPRRRPPAEAARPVLRRLLGAGGPDARHRAGRAGPPGRDLRRRRRAHRHRPELHRLGRPRGPPRRPAGRAAHAEVLAVPRPLRARRRGLHRLRVLPLRRGRDQGARRQVGPRARRAARRTADGRRGAPRTTPA